MSHFWATFPPTSIPDTVEIGEAIPNTRRPAFLWRIPPSHTLAVDTDLDRDTFRRQTGLFVIHLLGYFFGTRLQFEHWWVDSRIPTKPQADIVNPQRVVPPFLSTAVRTWRAWPEKDRKAMAGVLFMHDRVPGYEWPWERFNFEYTVFDG